MTGGVGCLGGEIQRLVKVKATVKKIRKRDGTLVDFDQKRITDAIFKAAQAVGGQDRSIAERLSDEVVRILEDKYVDRTPSVEEIQDLVEKVLIERGHAKTAKAYILYRKQHEELRRIRSTFLEVERVVDDYLGQRDWRVQENANVNYSLSGLMFHIATSTIANYTLDKIYPMEVADAHVNGDFHIHDLGMGVTGYCFDEETRILTEEGFKYFKDVTLQEGVATLNLKTGELEFQHPIAKQVFDFDGQALRWHGKQLDLLVTPEHRMLVRKWAYGRSRSKRKGILEKYAEVMKLRERGWGARRISQALGVPECTVNEWVYHGRKPKVKEYPKWEFITAGKLAKLSCYEFKRDAVWRGKNHAFFGLGGRELPMGDFLKFMGWYLSEGNVDVSKRGYRISISQMNEENQRRIAGIMRKLGLKPYITKFHVTAYSKELYMYLRQFGKSKEKFIPREIKELSPLLMRIFLTELFMGDGTFHDDKPATYVTYSRRLAEDVAECVIKTGFAASFSKREKGGYVVYVSHEALTPEFRGKPEFVRYKGKVYDLTVPNGTLLVERNGKIVWSGNCAGWSLGQLLAEGFNGVPSKVASKPPAHLDTALLQMVNFIGSLQNEWAGAQAFNSVDTLLAPFVHKDGLSYRQVRQAIQTFVFNLNVASRWGGQTPFTNMTLDLTVPEDLVSQHAVIGGKLSESTYAEYSEEAGMINRALIEVMLEGDMRGRPFTFPIPTYSLTEDFEWDEGISAALFGMTAKYGLPYFQNFINSNLNPTDVRSMCCHLRLSLEELKRNVTGGLFGSGDSTGSVGVVTINMPRLGYLSRNEEEFFERLEYVMELAKRSLEHKRELVERNIQSGLLPFTKRYLGTLRNHFSTIGLVGMNEALLNLFGYSIAEEGGKRFAVRTLRFMLKLIQRFQRETGNLYNLEATPAEGVSYRLAKIDKQKYPDIRTAGVRVPYYTNSTCLPVDSGLDLIEALKHQEELQTLYTGGTVFHIFLGESLEDGEGCKNLVRKVSHNTKLPYFTVTPTYSICDDHGFISGEHPSCPSCRRETEVYSRVVGYFRPVRNWNVGKREEFRQRVEYS